MWPLSCPFWNQFLIGTKEARRPRSRKENSKMRKEQPRSRSAESAIIGRNLSLYAVRHLESRDPYISYTQWIPHAPHHHRALLQTANSKRKRKLMGWTGPHNSFLMIIPPVSILLPPLPHGANSELNPEAKEELTGRCLSMLFRPSMMRRHAEGLVGRRRRSYAFQRLGTTFLWIPTRTRHVHVAS